MTPARLRPTDQSKGGYYGFWCAMTDRGMEAFLERVKAFRFLYDKSHPDYKDTQMKEDRWAIIAKEFEMPVETCEKKWRNARDHCVKIRNKLTTAMRSGVAAGKRPAVKWPYFDIVSSMLGPLPSNVAPVTHSAGSSLATLLTTGSTGHSPAQPPSISNHAPPRTAVDLLEITSNPNSEGDDDFEFGLVSGDDHCGDQQRAEAQVTVTQGQKRRKIDTQAQKREKPGVPSTDMTIQRRPEACATNLDGLHGRADDVCLNHGIAIGSRLKELPRRLRSEVLHKIDMAFYEAEQELYSEDTYA